MNAVSHPLPENISSACLVLHSTSWMFLSLPRWRSGKRSWFGIRKLVFAEPNQLGNTRSRKIFISNASFPLPSSRDQKPLALQWLTVTLWPHFSMADLSNDTSESNPTPFWRAMRLIWSGLLIVSFNKTRAFDQLNMLEEAQLIRIAVSSESLDVAFPRAIAQVPWISSRCIRSLTLSLTEHRAV